MPRALVLSAALLAAVAAACPGHAQPLTATVVNASEPTLCNEKDNVYFQFLSPKLRRFTVEATHPAYIGTLTADRTAPDFTHCDMSRDPVHVSRPREVILYESAQWRLIGFTFSTFWRPGDVPVRAGARTEHNLHLVQLWKRDGETAVEVLVVYPPDGYWRAKPLPPAHLSDSAYGSSFLVGPVEEKGRPFVAIRDIVFEPEQRRIRLSFARGGTAVMSLAALDRDRLALDITLDRAITTRPFAALRSMYVTDTSNDVARVAWREPGAPAWRQRPAMGWRRARALEFWAGRTTPSRHNTSAPDMILRGFGRTP